jgi:hypothetical protein
MNKRIQELAEQCHHRYSEHNIDLEKFAKLIVRECAGIYDKIDNGNLHMGTDDYLEALHKTFFGVE